MLTGRRGGGSVMLWYSVGYSVQGGETFITVTCEEAEACHHCTVIPTTKAYLKKTWKMVEGCHLLIKTDVMKGRRGCSRHGTLHVDLNLEESFETLVVLS